MLMHGLLSFLALSAIDNGVHLCILFISTVNRHRVNPKFNGSRSNCVPMALHCPESADTGPVVLKVVPVTDAAFSCNAMDQLVCVSLFPQSSVVQWTPTVLFGSTGDWVIIFFPVPVRA